MSKFAVLRDLSRPVTAGPFESLARAGVVSVTPSEPRVDVEDLGKAEVHALARDPEVSAIAPVMPTTLIRPVEMGDTDGGGGEGGDAAASTTAWGVTAVGADACARTGAGVVVSVLDTGIDAGHPAFAGVTVVQEDFSGSGNGDVQGHGTHCAGTVFGRDVEGTRIGVAVGVQRALIGKVLGDDGSGDSDMIFRGIQWAVGEGAQVISMSLGFDFAGLVARLVEANWPADLATSVALEAYRANLRMFDALMGMIDSRAAFGSGTVVVAAAGNESRRDVDADYEIGASLPAAAAGVVSVGALEQSAQGLKIARFSNTFPVVSAPGVSVRSAKSGGGLLSLNGTSMATPHVAGVAALWWEEVLASPLPATAATVTAKLLANATTSPLAAGVDVPDRGLGLVRAP